MGIWQKVPFVLASFTVAFIVAGTIINTLQFLAYYLVRPFSLNTFRVFNSYVVEMLWLSKSVL